MYCCVFFFFFFNDTATTEIYTLSLHDALPIRSARKSITYAQYFFEEGPVSEDVIRALAERCRAGVPAHVLLDGVGTVGMPTRYTDDLKDAGCQVKTFRAVRPWALRR